MIEFMQWIMCSAKFLTPNQKKTCDVLGYQFISLILMWCFSVIHSVFIMLCILVHTVDWSIFELKLLTMYLWLLMCFSEQKLHIPTDHCSFFINLS